jgi:hypothetical protein
VGEGVHVGVVGTSYTPQEELRHVTGRRDTAAGTGMMLGDRNDAAYPQATNGGTGGAPALYTFTLPKTWGTLTRLETVSGWQTEQLVREGRGMVKNVQKETRNRITLA